MDALTVVVTKAYVDGVLNSFRGISAVQRISIYADDVAFFIRPSLQDLQFIREALLVFGEASGLKVNYGKSMATIFRGEQEDKDRVTSLLHCALADFPIRYLGLQLATRRLTGNEWQPLLDMVKKRLRAGKEASYRGLGAWC